MRNDKEDNILRSDAIKAISLRARIPHDVVSAQYVNMAISAICSVPSADKPQEWIPCSKRLPEYRKTVLISTFGGVKTGFLDSTEAYGDFWEIIEDDATVALHSVYAWMPLPKPWKGADDEF